MRLPTRHSLALLLLTCAGLLASLDVRAQERDWSNEDYARDRIHEIAEGLAAGQRSVAEHDSLITLHAAAHGVDPDWLRAIIMVEAVRFPEEVGDRVGPMGMDAVAWAGLDAATVEAFSDVSENIRLAALLIQRIVERLPEGNQSLRVVASLYDDIGTEAVTPYGLKVEQAYAEQWWENRR